MKVGHQNEVPDCKLSNSSTAILGLLSSVVPGVQNAVPLGVMLCLLDVSATDYQEPCPKALLGRLPAWD